jgi:hypothetical protein
MAELLFYLFCFVFIGFIFKPSPKPISNIQQPAQEIVTVVTDARYYQAVTIITELEKYKSTHDKAMCLLQVLPETDNKTSVTEFLDFTDKVLKITKPQQPTRIIL